MGVKKTGKTTRVPKTTKKTKTAKKATQAKAEKRAKKNGEPKVESSAEPKVESIPEPNAEPEVKPDPEPNAEPKVKPAPEPKVESKPEPTPEPDPEPEPDPDPTPDPAPEPKIETRAETNGEVTIPDAPPRHFSSQAPAIITTVTPMTADEFAQHARRSDVPDWIVWVGDPLRVSVTFPGAGSFVAFARSYLLENTVDPVINLPESNLDALYAGRELRFAVVHRSGAVRPLLAETVPGGAASSRSLRILSKLALLDPEMTADPFRDDQLRCDLVIRAYEVDEADRRDPLRVGSHLFVPSKDVRLAPEHVDRPLALMLHGFTSHGEHIEEITRAMESLGFLGVLFNFDSFGGIKKAAEELRRRLMRVQDPLWQHGYVILAHSMGGLVARHYLNAVGSLWVAAHARARGGRRVSKAARRFRLPAPQGLVLLGTPNDGTFVDCTAPRFLHDMVTILLEMQRKVWGVSSFLPPWQPQSVEEVLKWDPEGVIDALNSEQTDRMPVPTLSVSGGLAEIEGAGIFNRFVNWLIQDVLSGHADGNDGLVPEDSADITAVLRMPRSATHNNSYPDHPRTNHSYLTDGQDVIEVVTDWILANCNSR
ncbi:MAG: alpha/beta fold hydrolase [Planctomycetota bacterium]|jgi:hypothetical protein